jgi:hypothetical protein
LGGEIADGFGRRRVFVLTAAVITMNPVWLYRRVPEYGAPRNTGA